MLFSFSNSLKKAFTIAATTSSRSNLSNIVSTTRGSSSAIYSTTSSSSDTTGIDSMVTTAKNLLFDVPVSNNGGRCRIIMYVDN